MWAPKWCRIYIYNSSVAEVSVFYLCERQFCRVINRKVFVIQSVNMHQGFVQAATLPPSLR